MSIYGGQRAYSARARMHARTHTHTHTRTQMRRYPIKFSKDRGLPITLALNGSLNADVSECSSLPTLFPTSFRFLPPPVPPPKLYSHAHKHARARARTHAHLAAEGSYDMILKKKVPYIDSWVLPPVCVCVCVCVYVCVYCTYIYTHT